MDEVRGGAGGKNRPRGRLGDRRPQSKRDSSRQRRAMAQSSSAAQSDHALGNEWEEKVGLLRSE